jgi:predicted CXXCH cytochrome family protein
MTAFDHMHKSRLRRVILCLLFFLCLAGPGCDPALKHDLLTVFFDGVPPLNGTKDTETKEAGIGESFEAGATQQGPAATAKMTEATETPPLPLVTQVQHTPHALKMCDGGHQTPHNTPGAAIGFSLLEDKHRLCAMCHDQMSQEELGKKYDWVHGPVQYGACTECHRPHESPNSYMLKVWPIQELCFQCHDQKKVFKTNQHANKEDTACTECHDPHGSQVRYFLRDS